MALKDLSTDAAADVLVRLAPLLDSIAGDEKIIERISTPIPKEGITKAARTVETFHRLFDCVPILLVDHRHEVFGILAVTNGKSVEEIAAQSIVQTKNDLKEILSDEDLQDFFTMFVS